MKLSQTKLDRSKGDYGKVVVRTPFGRCCVPPLSLWAVQLSVVLRLYLLWVVLVSSLLVLCGAAFLRLLEWCCRSPFSPKLKEVMFLRS